MEVPPAIAGASSGFETQPPSRTGSPFVTESGRSSGRPCRTVNTRNAQPVRASEASWPSSSTGLPHVRIRCLSGENPPTDLSNCDSTSMGPSPTFSRKPTTDDQVVVNPDRFVAQFDSEDVRFRRLKPATTRIALIRPGRGKRHACNACLHGTHDLCESVSCTCCHRVTAEADATK